MTKRQMKPLQDLTLMDRFLFSEAMDDPQFSEDVLSIIMGEDILLQELPQTEKEIRNQTLRKHIKLDVWAIDQNDSIYDTEVQKKNDKKNLPKRSRYYQALIDSKLLEEGETDYWKMNRVHIIMIGSFDLFGRSRYVYTFQMTCKEEPDLILNDEGYRIFLNTRGKDEENITLELKALLEFFECPTEEVANHSNSEKIKRMQKRVKALKESEEVGVKYMREWEEKVLERKQGMQDGEIAMQERMNKLISLLTEAGRTEDLIKSTKDKIFQEQLFKEFGL